IFGLSLWRIKKSDFFKNRISSTSNCYILTKIVTTQGNHKGLPLHQKIFVRLHKNIVVGAILYGCPE
ncbi:MAG: hypothetical protein KAI83_02080, partial [Thiomargarita sp.]|nr:hypothetical protein [Thiomargarita sp.]